MDQTLHSNTKECSVAELRYFTLMSVFSSWTRMLSLLSLYLNFKICSYIKKKRLLQKRVLQDQGTLLALAAAYIGGRRC